MNLVGAFVRALDPSPDEARQWFADELGRPEYQDSRSLFQRFMEWLGRRISDLQDTQGTGGVSLPPIVITVLVVLLAVGAAVLLTRVRAERRTRPERRTVLGNTTLGAPELRAAGAAALAAEEYGDAVLNYVRATARDADDRTLLTNAASLTAHEVGEELTLAFPLWDSRIRTVMRSFDEVAYGSGTASRDDALAARNTDEGLRAATPVHTRSTPVGLNAGVPGHLVAEPPVVGSAAAPAPQEPGAAPDPVWLRGGGAS